MVWFKREKPGLTSQKKKEMPNGLWLKCEGCGEVIYKKQLAQNSYVCSKCSFHFRIRGQDYIDLLLDPGSFQEIEQNLQSKDFLNFKDTKRYTERLKNAMNKTGLKEAIQIGYGKIGQIPIVFGVMDFSFIGGSMGCVVGEKVARAVDHALGKGIPLIIVSASGGARMMESILSLMQMAKTASRLAHFSDRGGLYISILTNPTTAGVVASYAMLGDINIAEPGALIGFAGPRVIKQTIGQDLPEGFQRAQFQLEHGFVDMVIKRNEMKETLVKILTFFVDR
ncbi:acetyl-CoA carboxylase carboxyltransferase subunit beta [bacterium]|nr:acetyl-CoA carboxylase carboxyltransferase subunit beta [bacterium]RQV93662.1 MAG: acetyl-CoA carboxylase carboxyltransferase subunit beta [bacterium]